MAWTVAFDAGTYTGEFHLSIVKGDDATTFGDVEFARVGIGLVKEGAGDIVVEG